MVECLLHKQPRGARLFGHSEALPRSYKRRRKQICLFLKMNVLLNNSKLALGKVPGQQAESASREDYSFLCRSPWRRSKMAEPRGMKKTFCPSKVMQGRLYFEMGTRRGLLSLCPPFFTFTKVNGFNALILCVLLSIWVGVAWFCSPRGISSGLSNRVTRCLSNFHVFI